MKNAALLPSVFLLLLSLSCSKENKDDDELTQDVMFQIAVAGTWKITLFAEGDQIETSNFQGYSFRFMSPSGVSAMNGTNVHSGAWGISKSSGDDSPTGLKFNLTFTEPETFEALSEDWDVVSATTLKIELRHISGGDGSIDFLTFVPV